MDRTEKRFLAGVFMGVVALGFISTLVLLLSPPTPFIDELAKIAPASESDREPSSLTDVKVAAPSKIISIDCSNEDQTITFDDTRVQLGGKFCGSKPGDTENLTAEIFNRTNGYVATVIHTADQNFITDLINLNEGENKLELNFIGPNPIKKKLTVTRKL